MSKFCSRRREDGSRCNEPHEEAGGYCSNCRREYQRDRYARIREAVAAPPEEDYNSSATERIANYRSKATKCPICNTEWAETRRKVFSITTPGVVPGSIGDIEEVCSRCHALYASLSTLSLRTLEELWQRVREAVERRTNTPTDAELAAMLIQSAKGKQRESRGSTSPGRVDVDSNEDGLDP